MRRMWSVLTVMATIALAGALPAIASADDITISPTTLPDATAGADYYFQLSAQMAPGVTQVGPFRFWISAGAPPDGMYLDETGVLRGTPSLPGQAQFTISVMDSVFGDPSAHSGSQAYTLNVGLPATPNEAQRVVTALPGYAERHSGCVGLLIEETLSGTSKHC